MFERIISRGRRLEDFIQKKLDDLKDNHKFRIHFGIHTKESIKAWDQQQSLRQNKNKKGLIMKLQWKYKRTCCQQKDKDGSVHQAAKAFTDEEWDDIFGSELHLTKTLKKFFAQQRAEAKRNKPMTLAQQKEYMSTYIKN
ncbi:hypothetical protein Tco_0093293 [Tanacetum coccineum]